MKSLTPWEGIVAFFFLDGGSINFLITLPRFSNIWKENFGLDIGQLNFELTNGKY